MNECQQSQQHCEDEIDIVEYIKVVYKRRKVIAALVLAGMFLAGIYSLLKPKMYEASATFFPMNVKEYYGAQSETFAMKRQLDIEDLIISILESRKMADKIIEELNLKKLWGIELMTSARKTLEGVSKITLEKNGMIKLAVRTENPELSAEIANAYVDNLDYFNRQLDIGAQRKIVQVIDRATVPEVRMPRGTVKNTLAAGIIFFTLGVFLAFFLEFIHASNIKKRLKEK